ncbi:MAG: cysteine hydrolase family protein [Nocardioidaceae bacterium]
MTDCLLVIDIQNDYFPGGAHPLHEPEAAADAASSVLARFRDRGAKVVHLQHVWDADDATFMRPGTPGAEPHPKLTPVGGEPVVRKEWPNGFRDTELADVLRTSEVDELVVVGMMTSMCVDATVRAACDLGYDVTVVADGCAAPDLEFAGRSVAAPDVQAAFLGALADGYATVIDSKQWLAAAVTSDR